MRRLKVLARLWLRALVRYLTGRWTTVPRLMPREALVAEMVRRARARWDVLVARRRDNRDLLTGMVIALTAGPNITPWSGWEHYRMTASRARRYDRDVPTRLVGRPVVVKMPNGTKIGLTEFHADYVPRQEQLTERRAKPQLRRAA